MAIAGTTTDYTNRKVDLEIFQTTEVPGPLVPLSLTVMSKGVSRKVTGLQKLVQRYARLFLTSLDTVAYDSGQGTDFLARMYRGLIQTNEHVIHAFVFANTSVLEQLGTSDSDPSLGAVPPNDERISTAVLLDFEIRRESATLYLSIEIINQAGDSTIFVLPVK